MSLFAEADFGLSLLRETALNQTTVLSPISVALALSLVHLGAGGNSKKQIKDALCKGSTHTACSAYFSSLQKELVQKDHPYLMNWIYCSKPGNISCVPENERKDFDPDYPAEDPLPSNGFFKLFHNRVPADYPLETTDALTMISNRIFVSNDVKIHKEFRDKLSSLFNTSVQNIDYTKAEEAAEIVNNYVKQETAGKIKKLVGQDSFEYGKIALLVNAVYFHGRWAELFLESALDKFFKKEGEFEEVKFMKHWKKRFPLLTTNNFFSLALPYANRRYRLTIALARKRFGLEEALKKISVAELTRIITNENMAHVNVALPDFKIDSEMQLSEVLQKIGITQPFTDEADLSGITDTLLMLGRVTHKATIDVNGRGSTAAAATSKEISIQVTAPPRMDPPVNFVADHPFLFVLSKEGHILFTGQYYG